MILWIIGGIVFSLIWLLIAERVGYFSGPERFKHSGFEVFFGGFLAWTIFYVLFVVL